MDLSINIREVQGVTVLELGGRLIFGAECESLRSQVRQLLAAGKKKILVNLEKVNYCDSAGLGSLTSVFASNKTQGGELKLVNPNQRVRAVLNLTRLDAVIEVHDKQAEALASFK